MAWATVIDISRHQGAVNFATMKAKGVDYLIMRSDNGGLEDTRFAGYYRDALAAGWPPHRIGVYPFLNPKRRNAAAAGVRSAEIVRRVTGRTDVLYMLDVESVAEEYPKGPFKVTADYVRTQRATVAAALPGCRIIGYSNRAFWNSSYGPNDDTLAGELEWIVPRYPLYSDAAYQSRGYPPAPAQWAAYAFSLAAGPYAPRGSGVWEGWQFSAGFNRQGPVYGCQSSDLDLNIVDAAVAARWFADDVPLPAGDDMPQYIAKYTDGYQVGDGNTRRYLANPDTLINKAVAAGQPLRDWADPTREIRSRADVTLVPTTSFADGNGGGPLGLDVRHLINQAIEGVAADTAALFDAVEAVDTNVGTANKAISVTNRNVVANGQAIANIPTDPTGGANPAEWEWVARPRTD